MLASQAFRITRTPDDDWFDTILEVDTELFVDPFLVFKEVGTVWASAHDEIIEHFNRAFMLVAEGNREPGSPAFRKAVDTLCFREPSEMCLGYTSKSTKGSGSGRVLARLMATAIASAIARGLKHPRHFEELGILQEGIGADRISDTACTILKPRLITYTQQIAARQGIPLDEHRLYGAAFDARRMRFDSPAVRLPTNPRIGGPLLLVPERFLAALPKLNADDWWENYENDRLRTDLDYEVMRNVSKAKIVAVAQANPDAVRAWIASREQDAASPYDLVGDPKGVVQWESSTREFALANPLRITPPQTAADFDAVIETIIDKVRLFIEDQRGWYLLWDGAKDKPELAAQLVLFGIARSYCESNNIVVDPEVDLGRGPVDFKFSNGYIHRAHLEIKKLHNGKFWNGLDRQLPTYMRSDEVHKGWFVAIRYRDGRQWDRKAAQLPRRVRAAAAFLDRDLRSALIDARPPLSASKL